jgi:hypothetical protein
VFEPEYTVVLEVNVGDVDSSRSYVHAPVTAVHDTT